MRKGFGPKSARLSAVFAKGLLIATVACSGVRAERDSPAREPADVVESVLRVRRGPFRERVLLSGTLEATQAVRIGTPRTPTWQVQIRWMDEDGVNVFKGQKIIEFDNSAFAADLEQQRLTVSKEEKEIQQQKAQADARAAELAFAIEQSRNKLKKTALEADVPQELIPLREYQEKQLAQQRARTALDKAEEELTTHHRTTEQDLEIRRISLEKTRYDIRVAEQAIADLVLEAPRDGVFIIGDVLRENRKLQAGDTVWPGYVVARIPDLNEMQVVAQLSDVDDGRVRIGMAALVRLDSYPELSFAGVVRDITPVAQETSPRSLRRAFRVKVALEETDPSRMRPGMAAQVDIRTPGADEVLLVSRAALDLSVSPPVAHLDNGGSVPVKLGRCNSFECVCEDGLEEGTRLRTKTGS